MVPVRNLYRLKTYTLFGRIFMIFVETFHYRKKNGPSKKPLRTPKSGGRLDDNSFPY